VLELLSDARVAFSEGKNLLPRTDGAARGDSALELYAAVLAQDAQNEEARDGVRRLYAVARSRIQADLSAGKLDEAMRLLAAFRTAGVASDATAKLEADIAAARPRWLIAQARAALASGDTATAGTLIGQIEAGGGDRAVLADLRRALEARSGEAQLNDLAARARTAISAGALLEPAADSARSRVEAMQKLSRTHPLTLALQRELQTALLARAQAATRSSQFELAQQLLSAAGELGSSADLASARKFLQSESDAARARAVAATAAATEPAKPVDTDAAAPADFIRARPVTPLSAAFPQRALDAGQHGYVIVEFTLNAKGRASELKVVEASLPGVFDASAMQAVKSGRYDTTALGASGQPRRARLRVAFK
jgi:TonB family protein